MNANIEKITITLGEKTIELSEIEARALYDKLHSLFGVVNIFPTVVKEYLPWAAPYTPVWNPPWKHEIICGGLGSGIGETTNKNEGEKSWMGHIKHSSGFTALM
jgi:hypothetical protein